MVSNIWDAIRSFVQCKEANIYSLLIDVSMFFTLIVCGEQIVLGLVGYGLIARKSTENSKFEVFICLRMDFLYVGSIHGHFIFLDFRECRIRFLCQIYCLIFIYLIVGMCSSSVVLADVKTINTTIHLPSQASHTSVLNMNSISCESLTFLFMDQALHVE